VYKQQADALTEYRDAVKARTGEIMEAWGLFEKVQTEKTTGAELTTNLRKQVTLLKGWKGDLTNIASRAGADFAKYLSDMGPSAVTEVRAIATMTQPELDKYVALWKEKMKQAKDQAVSELEGLRIATAEKVKALQDSLKPLGLSVEAFKGTWAVALGPLIELFGQIASKVVDAGTKVGEFFAKIAESNPFLSKMIFGFVALLPLLALILSPLAIGIGLFGGLSAAMGGVWMIIGPIVTGFAAVMGTVLLVGAVIVGLVAAFIYLWNNVAWFRDGLTAAWDYIKKKTAETWAAIVKAITPAIESVVSYVMAKLKVLQAFWDRNGKAIVQMAKNHFNNIWLIIKGVMGYILGLFQTVWPIIAGAVKIAWNLIKLIIDSSLDYIQGLIKVVMALIKGDWKGAWNAIKDTAKSIWKNIEQFFKNVDLKQIGKDIIKGLIVGIGSMANAVKDTVNGIVKNIKSSIKNALSINSPSKWMREEVGKWIPAGIAVGIDKNQKPLTSAIDGMASKIGYDSRSAMGVSGSNGGVTSSSTTNNNSPVNVYLTYGGNNPQDGVKMVDMVERELQRRLGRKSFMKGATV
jgi:phage-related protein